MLFIKCDHCKNQDICKYAEAVADLLSYIVDWQDEHIVNNLINVINIDCIRCEEN